MAKADSDSDFYQDLSAGSIRPRLDLFDPRETAAVANKELGLGEIIGAIAHGNSGSGVPISVSPILYRFTFGLEHLSAEELEQLWPFALRLAGSVATFETERRRAHLLADWALREVLPAALEANGATNAAENLRNFEPINNAANAVLAELEARSIGKINNGSVGSAAFAAANSAYFCSSPLGFEKAGISAAHVAADAIRAGAKREAILQMQLAVLDRVCP